MLPEKVSTSNEFYSLLNQLGLSFGESPSEKKGCLSIECYRRNSHFTKCCIDGRLLFLIWMERCYCNNTIYMDSLPRHDVAQSVWVYYCESNIDEYLKGINESLVKLGARQEIFLTMKEAMDWIQQENEIATLQHEQ